MIKFFEEKQDAIDYMKKMNKHSKQMIVMIDGPEDNFAVMTIDE